MIIDAELDLCPAYGWQVSPEFNTLIKRLGSGHERRRPQWTVVRHRFILPFMNIEDAAYLIELKAAFLAAYGSAHSFLVKDYSDFRADNETFAAGDGTATDFPLTITSSFGSATYTRSILYPLDPVFYVDGLETAATFNPVTQLVEFEEAPADLSVISWSGEFRVLVRFTSDTFPMSIDSRSGQNYAMNGSVELMEVFA